MSTGLSVSDLSLACFYWLILYGKKIVNFGRATCMLLPPYIRDWIPARSSRSFCHVPINSVYTFMAQVNHRAVCNTQYALAMRFGPFGLILLHRDVFL